MQQYNSTARWLHWSLGICFILLLAVGFFMQQMANSDLKWQIYAMHKSFGLTVLALMTFRIYWRLSHKAPALPNTVSNMEKVLAHISHGFLYIAGILMPVSGWVMSVASKHVPVWFGFFEASLPIDPSKPLAKLASAWHYWTAWVFMGLIISHIFAAFYHGVDKNGIIWRMWKKS